MIRFLTPKYFTAWSIVASNVEIDYFYYYVCNLFDELYGQTSC